MILFLLLLFFHYHLLVWLSMYRLSFFDISRIGQPGISNIFVHILPTHNIQSPCQRLLLSLKTSQNPFCVCVCRPIPCVHLRVVARLICHETRITHVGCSCVRCDLYSMPTPSSYLKLCAYSLSFDRILLYSRLLWFVVMSLMVSDMTSR